jgi:hypothetical protein
VQSPGSLGLRQKRNVCWKCLGDALELLWEQLIEYTRSGQAAHGSFIVR